MTTLEKFLAQQKLEAELARERKATIIPQRRSR